MIRTMKQNSPPGIGGVPERSEGGVVDQVPEKILQYETDLPPDSLSLVVPSYSRRGAALPITVRHFSVAFRVDDRSCRRAVELNTRRRRRLWKGGLECGCRTIGLKSRHRRSRIASCRGFRTHPSIMLFQPSTERLKPLMNPQKSPDQNSSAIHLYSNSLLLS